MGQTCTNGVADVGSYMLIVPPRVERKWGWKRDLPDHRDRYLRYSPALKETLPATVDLRPKEHFPVYDQGHLGSCTANALAAAFHFAQIKEGLPGFVPSRLFIYYNEREMEGYVCQDHGAYIRDGVKSLCEQGVCNEVVWPYLTEEFAKKPNSDAYANAAKNKAIEYAKVPHTLEDMKACLALGYPFAFGFVVFRSFLSPVTQATGKVTMPDPCCGCDRPLGGHAVLCCGYDDERQVFIVRNSWSDRWGDKGYFYLPYEYMANEYLASDFWAVKFVERGDFPTDEHEKKQRALKSGRALGGCCCSTSRRQAAART